ncbi:hypothetical protein GCM10020254_27080 [Streptomyces goshikiensis]
MIPWERAAVVRVRMSRARSARCSEAVGSSAKITAGSLTRGPRQGDPLALGPGQRGRAFAGEAADVEAVQPCAGGRLGGAVRGAADQQRQRGVLPDLELGQQPGLGVDPAEPVAAQPFADQGAHGVHGHAVEPDLALFGHQLPGEAAQQSGLATAARSRHREDLALADAGRDPDQAG